MKPRYTKSVVELAKDLPKVKQKSKKQEKKKSNQIDEFITVFCKRKAGRMFQVHISICQIKCPKSRRDKCEEYWDVMKEKFGKDKPVKRKYKRRKKAKGED